MTIWGINKHMLPEPITFMGRIIPLWATDERPASLQTTRNAAIEVSPVKLECMQTEIHSNTAQRSLL